MATLTLKLRLLAALQALLALLMGAHYGGGTGGVAELPVHGDTILPLLSAKEYVEDAQKYTLKESSTLSGAGEYATELAKSDPTITFRKWDGRASLALSYPIISTGSRTATTTEIKWGNSQVDVKAYPLEATTTAEDGAFEMLVVLKQHPASNVFTFSLTGWENFQFDYQPPLNEETHKPEVVSCTETQCFNKDGEAIANRPENVVGSYAVYYKGGKNYKLGDINYGAGKAYHIFRPKIVDALGISTWGDLSIQDGTLAITVSQKFLDDATYPVTIDPTLGKTAIGGSSFQDLVATVEVTSSTVPSEAGTVTTINGRVNCTGAGTGSYDNSIYSNSASAPANKLATSTATTSITSSGVWATTTISYTFASGEIMWIGEWGGGCNGGTKWTYFYDAGGNEAFRTGQTYPTWPHPFTKSGGGSENHSVYMTYTASGGAVVVPHRRNPSPIIVQ